MLVGLGIGLIILAQLSQRLVSPKLLAVDDFVEYWAAGRLNMTGGNPYSPDELLPLQIQAGRTQNVPVMMWNPPWTLALVMPFGAAGYLASRLVWLLVHLGIALACAGWLWTLYGGAQRRRWIGWLVALTFVPTLTALQVGQISLLMLAGLVLFTRFVRRQQWWLAGAALVLVAVKPQVCYLFFVAVLWWALEQRRWAVLAGAALATLATTTIALLFNPHVIEQYIYASTHYPPIHWATPTLGGTLRLLLGTDRFWLQYVPPLVGLAWLGVYRRSQGEWNWAEHLPVLLVASVATSAYTWTYDYVVLIVALVQIAAALHRRGLHWKAGLVIGAYGLIDGLALALHGRVDELWFMWLAPVLTLWYWLARRMVGKL